MRPCRQQNAGLSLRHHVESDYPNVMDAGGKINPLLCRFDALRPLGHKRIGLPAVPETVM